MMIWEQEAGALDDLSVSNASGRAQTKCKNISGLQIWMLHVHMLTKHILTLYPSGAFVRELLQLCIMYAHVWEKLLRCVYYVCMLTMYPSGASVRELLQCIDFVRTCVRELLECVYYVCTCVRRTLLVCVLCTLVCNEDIYLDRSQLPKETDDLHLKQNLHSFETSE